MENATSWIEEITEDALWAAFRRASLQTDHAECVYRLLVTTQASLGSDVQRLRDQLVRNP